MCWTWELTTPVLSANSRGVRQLLLLRAQHKATRSELYQKVGHFNSKWVFTPAHLISEPPPREARVGHHTGGGGNVNRGNFRGGGQFNNNANTSTIPQSNPIVGGGMRGNGMMGGMMRGGMPAMGMMGGMGIPPMANAMGGMGMPFGRGGGMMPQGPRGGMMNGGFNNRGGMMGGMGEYSSLAPFSAQVYGLLISLFYTGMGMMPNMGMGGRGGFGGSPMQGHFNPAFMQNQSGAGQFGQDGPRKRYRMEQGS
jgi:hypothetical protein